MAHELDSPECKASVVIVNPTDSPKSFGAGKDEILFTNNSHEFPIFEIELVERPKAKLKGNLEEPILIIGDFATKDFTFFIQYSRKDGTLGPRKGPYKAKHNHSGKQQGPGPGAEVAERGLGLASGAGSSGSGGAGSGATSARGKEQGPGPGTAGTGNVDIIDGSTSGDGGNGSGQAEPAMATTQS
jgi:hypothetical protein